MKKEAVKYSRKIEEAPYSLVENGKFNFGTFKGPIKNINPLEASEVFGFHLPEFLSNMRLKEWQAVQLGNKNYFMMAVVYTTKTIAMAQFKVFDKVNKRKYLYEKILPDWSINIANSLYDTRSFYESDDFSISIQNDIANNLIEVSVDIHSQKNLPNIKANFKGDYNLQKVEAMSVCLPFNKNRAMYSNKCFMPMQGSLSFDSAVSTFESADSFMILDDHKGFYPFEMKYDWVTAVGKSNGVAVAFNLTDNQVVNPHKYNENCVWLDYKLHLLPPVKVSRPQGIMSEWQINDEYDMVNLSFTPEVPGVVDIDLVLFKSKYYGPYGHFTGYLRDSELNKVEIDSFFGMGEKIFLRA